jgi:hypothetical protein
MLLGTLGRVPVLAILVFGLGLLLGLRLGQFDNGPAQLGRIHSLAADAVDTNVIPFTHMTRTTLLSRRASAHTSSAASVRFCVNAISSCHSIYVHRRRNVNPYQPKLLRERNGQRA